MSPKQINKSNKNKKATQPMKKKSSMSTPNSKVGGSQITPGESTAATPSRHVSPLTDLMAPRKSCCREPGALKTRTQLLEFRRTRHFGGLWTGYMEKEGFWSPLKWQVRRTPESVYGKTAILASAEMASSAEAILGSAEMACSAEARMVRLKELGYMKKQPFWLPPKWQVRLKPFWAPPKWHVRLKPEWVYGKTSILAYAEMTSSAEGNRVYGKTAILGSAEMASSAEGIRVYGKTAILESAEMASSAEARMAIWKNSNSGLR
ncbi:hypothetical protein DFH28DRAFT_928171 [Melampsora americana]|nr:hypothetical protein DFH28DRAFT_928171 [Melampsora americana]